MRNPPKAAQMVWKEGSLSVRIDEYARILRIDRQERGEQLRLSLEARPEAVEGWAGRTQGTKSKAILHTMQ